MVPEKLSSLENARIIREAINFSSLSENPIEEYSDSIVTFQEIIILLWLIAAVLYGTRILLLKLYINYQLKKCPPIKREDINELLEEKCKELNIIRKVKILYMDKDIGDGPSLVGIFRPKILLPRNIIEDNSIKEIEPILLHELIHIKRYDMFVNLIQIIIQVLFFFHPLVWYANKRIRELCEEVCDDITISVFNNNRKKYSEGILQVLERIVHEKKSRFAYVSFSERKHSLAERIIRITNQNYKFYKPLSIYSIIGIAVISIFSVSLSCDSPTNTIMGGEQTSFIQVVPNEQAGNFSQDQNSFISLTILDIGKYEVEGVPATSENLETVLKEALSKYKKKNLMIYNASDIPFEYLNKIMLSGYSLGFEKIALHEYYEQ